MYTAMHDRLRQQRETVDRIDSKAAILIGFLAVFLVGITSVPKDVYGIEHSRLLIDLLLGGSIICGLKSLWPRAWHSSPDPHELIRQELWTAEQAMAADAENAYASVVVNEELLSDKLWWFRVCLVLLATSVFVFVLSVAIKIGWQKI